MPAEQTLQVQGMSCDHCVRIVTQAVQQVDPAAEVKVDLASGRVDLRSDRPRAELVHAIEEEGYTVAPG